MCGAAMGLNESSDRSERRRKDVRLPSILNSPERIFDTDFLPKLTRRKRRNISLSPTMVAVQVSRISTATMARGKQNKCKQTQIEKVLLFKKPIEKVGLQINVPGQIWEGSM